jgi:diguanylate cyclase (GGDEF)-like protein/PAS domain S-box-containing protein
VAGPDPSELIASPALDLEGLRAAIVENLTELVAVVDGGAEIVAVNDNLARALGRRPDELIGQSALDLIDPVDFDRAAMLLDVRRDRGAPPGNATFGLRHADGTILPTNVTGCDVEVDGVTYFTVIGRPSYMLDAVETLLDRLLADAPMVETLSPILEFFTWRENGSHVAISWWEDGELNEVHTGLPAALRGIESRPDDPWGRARRSGDAVVVTDLADLGPEAETAATDAGLRVALIHPVAAAHLDVPALLTVWTSQPGLTPTVHSFAITRAERYIEMVLRWTDQVARLDSAANRDALTGLANRRAFFDAFEASPIDGAVLYCDLDGFKGVNDRWGHGVGDALLVEVGRRIAGVVRSGDLVARLGGDEFAVLLWSATETEAADVARRVGAVCDEPFVLDEATVSVGISVGLAHDPVQISQQTVEGADDALYAAKRGRPG